MINTWLPLVLSLLAMASAWGALSMQVARDHQQVEALSIKIDDLPTKVEALQERVEANGAVLDEVRRNQLKVLVKLGIDPVQR
jgi:hypothetical protein